MKLLDRINRTDTTVVMATHDATMVDQMRKRVIELDDGHVVRDEARGIYGYQSWETRRCEPRSASCFTNLSRNKSMTISLVVTMTVSLLLAALGLLIQAQADRTEKYFGDRLQIQVNLCTENSPAATCIGGTATDAQKRAMQQALRTNPEVKRFDVRSPAENYEQAKQLLGQTGTGRKQLETLGPDVFPESYFVTLADPQKSEGVVSELSGMDGVGSVTSLRRLLGPLFEILEKMRWAALGTSLLFRGGRPPGVQHDPHDGLRSPARDWHHASGRASSWHIQLPFVLESMLAALISRVLPRSGSSASCTSSSTATCAKPSVRSQRGCAGRRP